MATGEDYFGGIVVYMNEDAWGIEMSEQSTEVIWLTYENGVMAKASNSGNMAVLLKQAKKKTVFYNCNEISLSPI